MEPLEGTGYHFFQEKPLARVLQLPLTYCVINVEHSIRPLFLSKHYLSKNKIYCLDKIYQFIFGLSPRSYKEKPPIFFYCEGNVQLNWIQGILSFIKSILDDA